MALRARTCTAMVAAAAVAAIAVGAAPGGIPLAAGAPPAATAPGPTAIDLPRPSGPYLTGTTRVHLQDRGRVDPLDPRGRKRELMAQIWYPARAAAGKPFAPYAPPKEAAALQGFYPVPAGAFTATTHSRLGAPVLPGRHRVVFFYHGLCGARTDTTITNEQLASEGFVVVALANTHEAPAVEFPGGRVEETSDPKYCTASDPSVPAQRTILEKLLAVRVADTRFALDQLERINRGLNPDVERAPLPTGLARSMDTRRVGMYGHSFGGGTAAEVLRQDRRFVAGVDLDGFVPGRVAQTGLAKPFLVMGSSYHDQTQDPSWAQFLPRLSGWHRWIQVGKAGHYRFIDLGGSVKQWGLDKTLGTSNPETWRLVFGDIDDEVSQEAITRVTVSFFDRFLRCAPEPILDRPGDYYPELKDRTATIDD